MPDALPPDALRTLPRPPVTSRRRSQLEAFLVLRRNTLELWGEAAYREDVLPGRFLGRDQLMVNDPAAIRHVLVDNPDNYRRNVATHRLLQPLLGDGLFLAEGAAWRHQRRTIAPSMSPRAMPVLAGHIVTATEAHEAELRARAGRPFEMMPQLQHLALRIAAQSMFSLESAEFAAGLRALLLRYGLTLARPGFLDLLLPAGLSSPLDLKRARFRREWSAFMNRIIDLRESRPGAGDGEARPGADDGEARPRADDGEARPRADDGEAQPPASDAPRDLFDMLAAARDPETGQGFDRAQLRDEVSTMIIAGHETTAVTLFWCCYVAARHPEHQARIAAEAAPLDLSPAGAAAAMRQLTFTRAFVDETLRLYPPAFLITREARAPDVVAGRSIKPGTVVSISPWVLHRHIRRWRDPDAFDPGRFLPGAVPPERYAYLPFGAGPRVCVGAQFALTEAVLVLARLLRGFRLELFGRGEVMPRGVVTTQPDRPVRFMALAR